MSNYSEEHIESAGTSSIGGSGVSSIGDISEIPKVSAGYVRE